MDTFIDILLICGMVFMAVAGVLAFIAIIAAIVLGPYAIIGWAAYKIAALFAGQ